MHSRWEPVWTVVRELVPFLQGPLSVWGPPHVFSASCLAVRSSPDHSKPGCSQQHRSA